MPTIALKSKVQSTASEHSTLSLNIRHRLILDQPSDLIFDMKPTIPEAVDVLLFSNLIITVSGSLDGTRITPTELKASYIANHLVDFLRMNAGELGINAVSELYISENTRLLSLTLTASRRFPASTDALPVHFKLIALDLDYVWQSNPNATTSSQLNAAINPFARHLSLPYLTATDNAVGRFVTFHLVRRYPLIFGPWCQQLYIERSFFPSIFISIQSMMERSRSPIFRATCQSLFKLCKGEIMSVSVSTAGELSKYLGLEAAICGAPAIYPYKEEEAFFLCLERFYRLGMKRPNFRHLSLFPTIASSSENLLSDAPVTLDAFGVNRSSNQSPGVSGLPHVSLFEGTYMDGLSDVELNTGDKRHMRPPNSYWSNNGSQESLDQIYHSIETPFDVEWTEISDQDSCDDIYELFEDVGSCGIFSEQHPLDKLSSDLAVDSDIDCILEEPDSVWQISIDHDWPDSLSSQEYEQDSLGKVPSLGAYFLAQPLKVPTSLYFEDILDPFGGEQGWPDLDHLGKHNPNILANRCESLPLMQTKDVIEASQESSSDDHYFELESDVEIDLTPDHGTMASPKSSRSGPRALSYSGLGVDDYRFLVIEYDSDVAP